MKSKITALYERTCEPDAENIRKQKNNLTNVAKRYNFKNIQHFTDDGYACANTYRPGFTALMEAIHADQVSTLIIRDCTRLTRDNEILSNLLNQMDLHGVRLLSLNEKMDRLPLHIHDDDNNLDYELHGDYYFPMFIISESEKAPITSMWADMHMNYLKEHRPGRFNLLVTTGKLNSHLTKIDKQAKERYATLMDAYKEKWEITEELKANDVMQWIQLMNQARCYAEWNVLREIVLC